MGGVSLRPEANERRRQVLFSGAEVFEFVPEGEDEEDVSDGPEYEATYSRHLRRVCDRAESKQRSSADVIPGMILGPLGSDCCDSVGSPPEKVSEHPTFSPGEPHEGLEGLGKQVDTTSR